jgi:hypothetical protein
MPVVATAGGSLHDHGAALAALDRGLAVEDSAQELPGPLSEAREPYARYLGWLREEVAKMLGRA